MGLFDYITQGIHHRRESGVPALLWASGVGIAAGFIVGLLFAPEAGKETRKAIVKNTRNIAAKVKKTLMETVLDEPETEGA